MAEIHEWCLRGFRPYGCGSQPWYHFGVGAPPILVGIFVGILAEIGGRPATVCRERSVGAVLRMPERRKPTVDGCEILLGTTVQKFWFVMIPL